LISVESILARAKTGIFTERTHTLVGCLLGPPIAEHEATTIHCSGRFDIPS
jgi:hypothetical protein